MPRFRIDSARDRPTRVSMWAMPNSRLIAGWAMRQLLADALHGGVDGQAGLDADDHQVERVGQAVREGLLVGLDRWP